MTQRILIADDHQIFREGLCSLLKTLEDVEILGEADNGRSLIDMVKKSPPDMVILDVAMPGMNGVDAARQIKAFDDKIKVLALSMHSDSRFVKQMLQAGASGYLLKDCAFEELTLAMQTIANEQIYLSPGVTNLVVKDYLHHLSEGNTASPEILTPRERETLQLLAEGNSTGQIAKLLNISSKTVETHRRQIMNKLALKSIAELTKYAIREGITLLGE
ncbi:MAG: DNA-binding NarL/FixJ family response regulator [Gammaproteobacteria bacterium]|jgi:DNA-binding NarL/FixJ family response regulator